MTRLRALMCSFCLALMAMPTLAQVPTAQATKIGRFLGTKDGGIDVFRGIDYAAPPIGNLRWKPPQAKIYSAKIIRNAQNFKPACPQQGVSMPGETPPDTSEDCLYLNIWRPSGLSKRRQGKIPVLVWIHGGGFSNGNAAMPLYHGDKLSSQGIIVVTIAYRLGILGFLAHPDLSKESQDQGSGNYGLMDQIAALEWVHNHISDFGGDPDKVTIAGQSAGAMSVSLLISSPKAKGLFQRAIAQSGGIFEPIALAPHYLAPTAEKEGRTLMEALGAQDLEQMRALPVDRLLGATAFRVTHPVFGTPLLPLSPFDAYASDKISRIPLLLGSNASEARALISVKSVTQENFKTELANSLGSLPPQLISAYGYHNDDEAKQARLDLERDLRFGWDMWQWTRLHSKIAPTYAYYFHHAPPFSEDSPYRDWQASHFVELWYMFDHLNQAPGTWTPADKRLAKAMSRAWVSFIKTGQPQLPSPNHWPAYEAKDPRLLIIDPALKNGPHPDQTRLEAIDKIYQGLR